MLFDSLKVNYVRNITDAHIEPSAHLNIIVGPNASGKTALLEAMHLLARARSFRTPRIKDVIQHNKDTLRVIAQVSKSQASRVPTGIEKTYGTTLIRYNGEPLKTVSEQANNIPLLVITPDTQTLVTGSPKQRRHWLDWAMFHVEPSYIHKWRSYQKALRHRNILLKRGGSNQQLSSWESSMSGAAVALDELRRKFVGTLREQLITTAQKSFSLSPQISFDSGWPEDILFKEYLEKDREKDRRLGYTRYGPHKADIHFLAEDLLLSQVYSRGQIKRFIAVLLLAQAKTYEVINEDKPVFLIDDYAAELDSRAREELLDLLMNYGGQIFMTSTDEDEALLNTGSASLFHVERGKFHKVIK
jgi:DNA replication and repair protein RecF